VWFGLCFDDVGIGTRIAVEGANPVVIETVRRQISDALTGSDDRQTIVSR